MTATVLALPVERRPGDGGMAARRAVARWAWRLFRREWRQQLLVLALITVAVAATVIGSTVAANTARPASSTFGTAQDLVTLQGSDAHLASQLAGLEHLFGRLDVIENQTLNIPGSVETYDLRAQDPHGPFGQPMLSLVSGRYPEGSGQVALTATVASAFHAHVGGVWREGGASWRVVGIVKNPVNFLDQFALVAPGQVAHPTQVTVLFDAHSEVSTSTLSQLRALGITQNVQTPSSLSQSSAFNPETLSIAGLTLGMLLIALVAVGGFTVLAQRRLRSLGMLASLGAAPRNIGLVVRANGAVVGLVGAVIGTAVGVAAWLIYRPILEASANHVIGTWSLPWLVVVLAMVLSVVAAYFAASRPARSMTRVPVVAALSGRPEPPRQVRRSALPGIAFLVAAFLVLGYSGGTASQGSAMVELVVGLILLIPGVILCAPFCLSVLSRVGR